MQPLAIKFVSNTFWIAMRIQLSALTLCLAMVGYQPISNAFGRRSIDCDAAKRGFTISVPQGIGVDIKLACGGDIADAQLSDPSRFVARKRGPQHAYIKMVGRLNFPGNLTSGDGSTMFSLIMTNGDVFQFRVVPGNSSAASLLDIGAIEKSASSPSLLRTETQKLPVPSVLPKPEKLTELPPPPSLQHDSIPQIADLPVAVVPASPVAQHEEAPVNFTKTVKPKKPKKVKHKKVDNPPPLPFPSLVFPEKVAVPVASAVTPVVSAKKRDVHPSVSLLKGLNTAKSLKKVVYRSRLWDKTQDAIYLLRIGKSIEVASVRAGVKLSTLRSMIACTPKSCTIEK